MSLGHPPHTIGIVAALMAYLAAPPVFGTTVADAPDSRDLPRAQLFSENGYAVPEGELPVQLVTVGEPDENVTLDDWETAVQHAVATWNDVPCSFARMEYVGHRPSMDDVASGETPVLFANASEGPGCLPEGLIGWTSLDGCGGVDEKVVHLNAAEFTWAVEPRPFDAYNPGGAPAFVDVESVVTHELGHVLGLSHSDDTLATMFASYRVDGGMRTLAVDDKLGVCELYSVEDSPPECTENADCPGETSCELVSGESQSYTLCHEVRGVLMDDCAPDNLICEERCLMETESQTGYCTYSCPDDDFCGEGFDCEEGVFQDSDASYCVFVGETGGDPGSCPCTTVDRTARVEPRLVLVLWGVMVAAVWWRRRG